MSFLNSNLKVNSHWWKPFSTVLYLDKARLVDLHRKRNSDMFYRSIRTYVLESTKAPKMYAINERFCFFHACKGSITQQMSKWKPERSWQASFKQS